jgi:hypothetical protein
MVPWKYPRGINAQRLKRVFNIDIETCGECGGPVKVIACIEDPVVIEKILTHLQEKLTSVPEVCGRQAGRHRLTCLADTIKPFTPFQWRLPRRESQDAGCPDARDSRARGRGEGE